MHSMNKNENTINVLGSKPEKRKTCQEKQGIPFPSKHNIPPNPYCLLILYIYNYYIQLKFYTTRVKSIKFKQSLINPAKVTESNPQYSLAQGHLK